MPDGRTKGASGTRPPDSYPTIFHQIVADKGSGILDQRELQLGGRRPWTVTSIGVRFRNFISDLRDTKSHYHHEAAKFYRWSFVRHGDHHFQVVAKPPPMPKGLPKKT